MRRACLSLLCVLVSAVIVSGDTEMKCGNNVNCTFDPVLLTLTVSGSGEMEDYYGNTPWDSYRRQIHRVVIEDDVESIGNFAFYCCENLRNVTIPSSVKTIGDHAFDGCYCLSEVNIPHGVTSIGDSAFNLCKELTSVNIPDSVSSIGNNTFSQCGSLSSVVIPDSVTSLGDGVFSSCTNLSSVVIGSSVASIGSRAFLDCSSLFEVIIPNNVVSIGSEAFVRCYNLSSVVIGDGVISIGNNAFQNCNNLKSVVLGDSVSSIGDFAFYQCPNLTAIIIPESVESIGELAFGNCYSLRSVFYLGTLNLTDWFSGVANMCAGNNLTSSNDLCRLFLNASNLCYEPTLVDGNVSSRLRTNMTRFLSQRDGCQAFICDNETGEANKSVCGDIGGVSRMCLNHSCIISGKPSGKQWSVEIDLTQAVDVADMDVTDISNDIAVKFGIDPNEMEIGWESDDEGYVVRVVVYLDEKETADAIEETIEKCASQN